MPAPSQADVFQYVHVLGTSLTDKSKSIVAQIGSVNGKGQTDADNVKWMQHVGFASRPSNAVIGSGAASALVVRIGSTELAIASQDERYLEIYGALAEGETAIYSTGPDGSAQGRILLKKDGSINLYSRKGNAASGAGMMIQLDASGSAIRLVNAAGNGVIIDDDGVKITAGGSSLTLASSGDASLVAKGQLQLDGASGCLGNNPVPGVTNALMGPTGLVGVANPKWVFGVA